MSRSDFEEGFIKDNSIYRKGWRRHPDRKIGEVKGGDSKISIEYFRDRFSRLRTKISNLNQRIDSEPNKGSFLMSLLHMRENLSSHDGLGDYEKLERQLDQLIDTIRETIRKNRLRNLEIKTSLLQEVKEAANEVNWRTASQLINEIRSKWIRTGNMTENARIEEEFWEIINDFFERRRSFYEDKKKLATHYEATYRDLISQAEKLETTDLKKRKEQINDLKTKWRDNGPVSSEIYKPLVKSFHDALKAGMARPGESIASIFTEIRDACKEKTPGNRVLNAYQVKIKSLKTLSEKDREFRKEAFDLIFRCLELNFINNQCEKRYKKFNEKPQKEQNDLKIDLVKELLDRDKSDLSIFELNMEKFNSRDKEITKMMEKKVMRQKQKIALKESILGELKGNK